MPSRSQHNDADVKQLQEFLKEKNAAWQVPERRLRKFVNRHAAEAAIPKTTKTDVDGQSKKPRKRVGGLMKTVFGGGKKSAPEEDKVPVAEIETTIPESPVEWEEENVEPEPAAEDNPAETETPKEADHNMPESEDAYKDENDGTKEKACTPCAGCLLM